MGKAEIDIQPQMSPSNNWGAYYKSLADPTLYNPLHCPFAGSRRYKDHSLLS